MPSLTVRELSVTTCQLGEGPRWHHERDELLWVDVEARHFHRATLDERGNLTDLRTLALDHPVSAVAPAVGGGYVAAAAQGFLFVDDDGTVTELAQPEADNPGVRMNDGACDESGRFWAGTLAHDLTPGAGTLYRLELDGTCTAVLTGLTISNGIDWSPDGATMYLADSGTADVQALAFDPESGELGAGRTLLRIERPGIAPDGLTVDTDGGIWVALYNGWAVQRYHPDGRLDVTVELPVARPTSCAFGGRDLGTLFVTSSRRGLDEHDLLTQPGAGKVFRIDGTGRRGRHCRPYRGRVLAK